tara:strand:+ start:507 stop:770 length:264 start_codon:yes stop_codon:yes gene_type:complete
MRIGIDLGGTKIEGIVLDDSGVEVARAHRGAAWRLRGNPHSNRPTRHEDRSHARGCHAGRDRHTRDSLSGHRTDQECELDMADRQAV